MTTVPFDTLKLAERLTGGGFSDEQSRSVAGALAEAMGGADLATKTDLELLRAEMRNLGQQLTIRLGGMMVLGVGIILAALRAFSH